MGTAAGTVRRGKNSGENQSSDEWNHIKLTLDLPGMPVVEIYRTLLCARANDVLESGDLLGKPS